MEKIFLIVELGDDYALRYIGVTDGSEVYAKLVQYTGNSSFPQYIQMSESDAEDITGQVENLLYVRTLGINTSDVNHDIRIFPAKPAYHEILEEIEKSIQELVL